jgi:hypothetical protein
VDSNGNHFALNTYNNDVSRQMVDVGPAPPFAVGGRRKRKTRSKRGGLLLSDSFLHSSFLFPKLAAPVFKSCRVLSFIILRFIS